MKYFDWDKGKNALLKNKRGVSFEEVLRAFYEERVVDDIQHPNQKQYPNQRIMIVNINNYAYLVPCIENNEEIFFKTIVPSRKATKYYLINK